MKKWNLFFVIVFALLSAVIIGEACVPGSASGEQSMDFAKLFYTGGHYSNPESLVIQGADEIEEKAKSTYTVDVLPTDCSNKSVVWKVSDKTIAWMNETGVLDGIAPGKVTITASSIRDSKVYATKEVTVVKAKMTKLTASLSKKTVVKGATAFISCSSNITWLKPNQFKYISSDENIATADGNGYINTFEVGQVTFTVSCPIYSTSLSSTVSLTVVSGTLNKPKSISYDGISSLYRGDSGKFSPVFDAEANDLTFICSGSDAEVLTLSIHGTYYGKKSGTATVTLTSFADSSLSTSFQITVIPAAVATIEILAETVKAYQTVPLDFTYTTNPADRLLDNLEFTFVSSDPKTASFSGKYLTGYKDGKITVTVTWTGDAKVTQSKEIKIDNNGQTSFYSFHVFLRKLAGHFCLFMLTGIFGFLSFTFVFLHDKKQWIISLSCLLCGFLLACTSESIQYFIPRRYMMWSDIGLDFAGFAFAVFLMWLIFYLVGRKKLKKAQQDLKKDAESPNSKS